MRRTIATAVAAAMVVTACSSRPPFISAWYLTPENDCDKRITVLLVNSGRKGVVIERIELNEPSGQVLQDTPRHLARGEILELHPEQARAEGTCTLAATGSEKPSGERRCLPISLIVSASRKRGSSVRVDIERPMPTAYASDAFVACGGRAFAQPRLIQSVGPKN